MQFREWHGRPVREDRRKMRVPQLFFASVNLGMIVQNLEKSRGRM